MKRIASLALFALAAPALLAAESLVIAGAGFAGKWDTEIDLANVSLSPLEVSLSVQGLPLGAPCPPNCTGKTYSLPARGTITVRASDFIGALYQGPQMVRVETGPGVPLPVVHARSVSSENSCQFAELPVLRDSSLNGLTAPVLVFPGAARGEGVYSNLILEVLGGPPSSVEVELLDASGRLLARGAFVVPGESTFAAFTLVDIAAYFGVVALEKGQVRALKAPGEGTLWGVLATVAAEGSLRVSVGANP